MEDVEARFAHLLQPIRDLTKNWEVDVAAQLGEYLEEVRAPPGSEAGLGLPGCPAASWCVSIRHSDCTCPQARFFFNSPISAPPNYPLFD